MVDGQDLFSKGGVYYYIAIVGIVQVTLNIQSTLIKPVIVLKLVCIYV